MDKEYLPEYKDIFNAFQKINDRPAINNPQLCTIHHDTYTAAEDSAGDERIFKHSDEPVKKKRRNAFR
jgi:hypothetical protein